MRVPRRQVALSHRARDRDEGLRRRSVPRRETGLRPVCASRALPADAGDDGDAAGRLLPRAAPPMPLTHTAQMKARIDTPEGRAQYSARFGAVEPVFAQPLLQQGAHALHAARPYEGRWAVEILLPRAQHRETRPRGVRDGRVVGAPRAGWAPGDATCTRATSNGSGLAVPRRSPSSRRGLGDALMRVFLQPQRPSSAAGESNKSAAKPRNPQIARDLAPLSWTLEFYATRRSKAMGD